MVVGLLTARRRRSRDP